MGKDVRVRFVAQDDVSPVLRGMAGRISSFGRGMLKIAAGLGLADSFKRIGLAIKGSIEAAAGAYPKLAAGFQGVADKWGEFRIQAGSAFLQILQPMIPLLEKLLDLSIKIATALPTGFAKLKMFAGNVMNVIRPGSGMDLLVSGQVDLADMPRRQAELAADRAAAERERQRIEREKAQAKAAAAARAEQERLHKMMAGREEKFGPNGPSQATQEDQYLAGARSAQAYADAQRELNATLAEMPKELEVGRAALEVTNAAMEDSAAHVAELFDLFGGAFQTLAEGLGAAAMGTAKFGEVMKKATTEAVSAYARKHAGLELAKAAASFAEGTWPPNPLAIKAGLQHLAAAAAFGALAGAAGAIGSSGGGSRGSGSLSSENARQTNRELATRGKLVLNFKDGIIGTRSPEMRDIVVGLMREAGELREIEVRTSP